MFGSKINRDDNDVQSRVAMDIGSGPRENQRVHRAEASRRRIAQTLNAAYGDGLLSDETFADRVSQLLEARLVYPGRLIGDLNLRASRSAGFARLRSALRTALWRLQDSILRQDSEGPVLLALDWNGGQQELLVGRHHSCDVVLADPTVSRRHARLIRRDAAWVLQDLASTNGTLVNGVRVGRSEVRPGDRLRLGDQRLKID